MNELKEGQIYTLNDGETYDIIHEHYYDGSGSWCYEIAIMKDIFSNDKKLVWHGDGKIIEWEHIAIDKIRKEGIFVGQIGVTHKYTDDRLVKMEE